MTDNYLRKAQPANIACLPKLKEFAVGFGILAGRGPSCLEDPIRSIESDKELTYRFRDLGGIGVECLGNMLRVDAQDKDFGVQSVCKKYLNVKTDAYHCSAEDRERHESKLSECLREQQEHTEELEELELERVDFANKIATINSLPRRVKARQVIEDAREALALLERDHADEEERLTSSYKASCDETLQKMDHKCVELKKERQYGATLMTNLQNYKTIEDAKFKEKRECEDFVSDVNAIIGLDNDTCALENEDNVTIHDIRKWIEEGLKLSLPHEENVISHFFQHTGTQPNRYLTRASATIMNRFLKNIGWCKSPPCIMSGIKFNVHPIKIWCDGRRITESIDEMVLRLQQTFFVGAELPENGKIRLKELTVKREEAARKAARIKAEEDEAERERLRMAPNSTQKRSLDAIWAHSAKRRRTSNMPKDADGGSSSPVGKSKKQDITFKTPQKKSGAENLDTFVV